MLAARAPRRTPTGSRQRTSRLSRDGTTEMLRCNQIKFQLIFRDKIYISNNISGEKTTRAIQEK